MHFAAFARLLAGLYVDVATIAAPTRGDGAPRGSHARPAAARAAAAASQSAVAAAGAGAAPVPGAPAFDPRGGRAAEARVAMSAAAADPDAGIGLAPTAPPAVTARSHALPGLTPGAVVSRDRALADRVSAGLAAMDALPVHLPRGVAGERAS